MALINDIDQDLADSMREGVVARTSTLRLVKSSLKNEQIKLGHELSEAEVLKVIQREAKQRREAIEQYRAGNRTDLAESEHNELEIIEKYLPQQMGAAELEALVDQVIKDSDAGDVSKMGAVIGEVIKRAQGRADGSAVSQLVRQKLA